MPVTCLKCLWNVDGAMFVCLASSSIWKGLAKFSLSQETARATWPACVPVLLKNLRQPPWLPDLAQNHGRENGNSSWVVQQIHEPDKGFKQFRSGPGDIGGLLFGCV